MPKKVCIVSYYWPPAGGPGVQRWVKFCKYLPDFDIEPIVYIPKNPSYPIIDESIIVEGNPIILKNKIWEPYRIAELFSKKNKDFKAGQFQEVKKQGFLSKLSIFIRGNFFIPDARKFWIKPSVKFLSQYIKENNIDTLITTGPPHSMHLIGIKLKKQFPSIKWIADFRDPWTGISYHSELRLSQYAKNKHKKLEKEVLENSDQVILTSKTDAVNFKTLGAKEVTTITNGFDADITPQNLNSTHFTISYIGMLEQLRNPKILWKELANLFSNNEEFKKNARLVFTGKIDESITKEITAVIPKENLVFNGYVSHDKALEKIKDSNLLLLTSFNEGKQKGIIPGKLFEYLPYSTPILSVGTKDSDVSTILDKTQSGKHFFYSEGEEIRNYILEQYNHWKNKNPLQINEEEIIKFHRKNLAESLAKVIKN